MSTREDTPVVGDLDTVRVEDMVGGVGGAVTWSTEDTGDIATAEASFAGAVDDAGRLDAVLLLAELGEVERAWARLEGIGDEAMRERARRCLDDAPSALAAPPTEGGDEGDDDDAWAQVARGPDADAALADAFLEWFGGRRDLYAQQWYDEARRRSGYRPVEQPLTRAVAQRHLAGKATIGQYLLSPDGSVHFGVIDLDLDANAMGTLRATRGDGASAAEHAEVRRYARALLRAAASLGLPMFAEDSGGRGMHLWLFCRPRRPARAVRSALQAVVAAAGPQPAEVGVEVFPKQDRVGPRGLSSLVKLPLGVHQVSMRRCHLLDEGLAPIDDPRAALARLVACDDAALDAVVARRVVAMPAPELDATPPLPGGPPPAPLALPEVLRGIDGGRPEKDAARAMIDGCAALRAAVTEAYDQRSMSPGAARVVTYTLGLIGRDPSTARDTLVAGHASVKELERAQRGLPTPMGCSRVRALLGERCDRCLREGDPYPSPVLHALRATAGAVAPRRFAGAEAPLQVEDPLATIGAALRRIEHRLDRLDRVDRVDRVDRLGRVDRNEGSSTVRPTQGLQGMHGAQGAGAARGADADEEAPT